MTPKEDTRRLDLEIAEKERDQARAAMLESRAAMEHVHEALIDREEQLDEARAKLVAAETALVAADAMREVAIVAGGVLDRQTEEQAREVCDAYDTARERVLR